MYSVGTVDFWFVYNSWPVAWERGVAPADA